MGDADNPAITALEENVYVVWEWNKGSPGSPSDILYTYSKDGGMTFGSFTNLSNDPDSSTSPTIALSN